MEEKQKSKVLIYIIVVLVLTILVMAIAGIFGYKILTDKINELANKNENTNNVQNENAQQAVTESKEEIAKRVFLKYLPEMYKDAKMLDSKIDKIEIEDNEQYKAQWHGEFKYEDTIVANITYSVKPEDIENGIWYAGNGGEQEGGWITNKNIIVVIARQTPNSEYTVQDIGTGGGVGIELNYQNIKINNNDRIVTVEKVAELGEIEKSEDSENEYRYYNVNLIVKIDGKETEKLDTIQYYMDENGEDILQCVTTVENIKVMSGNDSKEYILIEVTESDSDHYFYVDYYIISEDGKQIGHLKDDTFSGVIINGQSKKYLEYKENYFIQYIGIAPTEQNEEKLEEYKYTVNNGKLEKELIKTYKKGEFELSGKTW